MSTRSWKKSRAQPAILTVLVTNMTLPLGIASAKAPTKAARSTYETVKKNLSSGVSQAGPSSWTRRAMEAMRRALSASEEKNCAAMIV